MRRQLAWIAAGWVIVIALFFVVNSVLVDSGAFRMQSDGWCELGMLHDPNPSDPDCAGWGQ